MRVHSTDSGANPVCARLLSPFSRVRLFETPWTVAQQAPLSMELPRQEYRNGLPFPFHLLLGSQILLLLNHQGSPNKDLNFH